MSDAVFPITLGPLVLSEIFSMLSECIALLVLVRITRADELCQAALVCKAFAFAVSRVYQVGGLRFSRIGEAFFEPRQVSQNCALR
jgi:hypothetical protein